MNFAERIDRISKFLDQSREGLAHDRCHFDNSITGVKCFRCAEVNGYCYEHAGRVYATPAEDLRLKWSEPTLTEVEFYVTGHSSAWWAHRKRFSAVGRDPSEAIENLRTFRRAWGHKERRPEDSEFLIIAMQNDALGQSANKEQQNG